MSWEFWICCYFQEKSKLSNKFIRFLSKDKTGQGAIYCGPFVPLNKGPPPRSTACQQQQREWSIWFLWHRRCCCSSVCFSLAPLVQHPARGTASLLVPRETLPSVPLLLPSTSSHPCPTPTSRFYRRPLMLFVSFYFVVLDWTDWINWPFSRWNKGCAWKLGLAQREWYKLCLYDKESAYPTLLWFLLGYGFHFISCWSLQHSTESRLAPYLPQVLLSLFFNYNNQEVSHSHCGLIVCSTWLIVAELVHVMEETIFPSTPMVQYLNYLPLSGISSLFNMIIFLVCSWNSAQAWNPRWNLQQLPGDKPGLLHI